MTDRTIFGPVRVDYSTRHFLLPLQPGGTYDLPFHRFAPSCESALFEMERMRGKNWCRGELFACLFDAVMHVRPWETRAAPAAEKETT